MTNHKNSTPVPRNKPIDFEVIKEYISFHDKYHGREFNEDDLENVCTKLFSNETEEEQKQKLLFRLAHTPYPHAYKIIQEFYFESEGFLQDWSASCMEECQMHVQDYLSTESGIDIEEGVSMISSPGGGNGIKLRFWAVFISKDDISFSDKNKEKFSNTIKKHFKENDSDIEKIEWSDTYLVLTALGSMDVSVDDLIMPVLRMNKDFLRYHYFVINTNYPTDEEIEEYRNEQKQS